MCVIADDNGVESLAGIMGGEASGCDENTTDVLIESALWNEINIAQTGRKLASIPMRAIVSSAASIQPSWCRDSEMATKLVMDLCGGTPSEIVVAARRMAMTWVIDFPISEVKRPRRH